MDASWLAIIITLGLAFTIWIVLYIADGISAKKHGRPRNKRYTLMFVIACSVLIVSGVVLALLYILANAVMAGM